MWFYVILGGLFTLYAADLLLLVVVASLARAKELRDTIKKYRLDHPDEPMMAGCGGCLMPIPRGAPSPLSKFNTNLKPSPLPIGIPPAEALAKGAKPLLQAKPPPLTAFLSDNELVAAEQAADLRKATCRGDGKAADSPPEDAVTSASGGESAVEDLSSSYSEDRNSLRSSNEARPPPPRGAVHIPPSATATAGPPLPLLPSATGRPPTSAAASLCPVRVPRQAYDGSGSSGREIFPSTPLPPASAILPLAIAALPSPLSPTASSYAASDTEVASGDVILRKRGAIGNPASYLPPRHLPLPLSRPARDNGDDASGHPADSAADAEDAATGAEEMDPEASAKSLQGMEGTADAPTAPHRQAVADRSPRLPENPRQYPKVLIQLPMYNEETYAALIVQRCCKIRWPKDRLLVQVLDDSTRQEVRAKVDAAVIALIEEGQPVQVLRRDNRQGYKAGALVEGLNQLQGQGFEYAAIFDADFDPPEDFLEEIIPHLYGDPQLGFVQTRWQSPSHSFLTWAQKVNLDFHFDVEQRARSYLGWFFNFNGTAGVWRIRAIEDAGGWESDTVVEDMDLSLRCYLRGWTARYLPHVESPNELPSDLATYKTQQFRWLAGPMQILTKMIVLIWQARVINLLSRLNCYWFFLRYVMFAVITVGVLSVPPVVLWVDPWEWDWPQIFFIATVNFAMILYLYVTPWSVPYLLFSVAVGYFKSWAMMSGLVGAEKSKKWKVTKKAGAATSAAPSGGFQWPKIQPPYLLELVLMTYYGGMAAACFVLVNYLLGVYCAGMAILFLALAFGDSFL